jgi:cell division septal protein FtsQ
MTEKSGKILGTFVFVVLISCLIYLVFFSNRKTDKGEVKMIEIFGNHLLPVNEYMSYTRLGNSSKFGNLTLQTIKQRFEKHPYVLNADVEFAGSHTVKVHLTEKNIEAVLLSANEPNFITDDFQILPLLPNTKFMDFPVISNPSFEKEMKPLSYIKAYDIVEAFKIIESAKLTNQSMSKRLSEINLRKGGDIILTFSGVKPPVIFGKNEAPRKMVYLDIMWSKIIEQNSLADNSEYIDLRFSNEIFVGASEKTGYTE